MAVNCGGVGLETKMNVLLFNTPTYAEELHPEKFIKKNKFWGFLIGEKGILSSKNLITGQQPPFGIMLLSTVLKREGHKVYVKDGSFTKKRDILEFMNRHNIDVVGVSCVSYNFGRAKEIIKEIKKEFPKVVMIIGGAHPNAVKEKCLKESKHIDVAVYGDGEYVMLDILDRLKKKESLRGLKGTVVREGDKIIKNPPRQFIKNLDDLPFLDRDCIDIKKYQPTAFFYKKLPWTAMFGSRGCPYRCIFCHSSKQVRFRSPKNIVDEIEFIINKYCVKDVTFYDENFILNRKWVMDICNEILRRKIKVIWCANARVDCVDEEVLRLMKKAGCWRLLWGIESGVQKNLDRLKKDFKVEKVRNAIKLAKKARIESYGMFIFGVPGETYKEALKTIDFACSLGLDYVNYSVMDPYPGTELYEEVKKEPGFLGLIGLGGGGISYVSPQMTEDKLKKLVELGFKKFYLRPSYILWRITKLRSWEDIKRHIRGILLMIGN